MSPCTYIQHIKNTLEKPQIHLYNMYDEDLVPTLGCRVRRVRRTKTKKKKKKLRDPEYLAVM